MALETDVVVLWGEFFQAVAASSQGTPARCTPVRKCEPGGVAPEEALLHLHAFPGRPMNQEKDSVVSIQKSAALKALGDIAPKISHSRYVCGVPHRIFGRVPTML
ncbi:hypothetical protein FHS42_006877 [Streptomyces zagrosensis]|uniref:Uncharacterized protein n=1 Tax=Streptomyces zagrosensis TaxID=1042984 RepID=A0A7W9V2Y6_9ACTN|nr:hypothetical protein [Streptomyces zagrosensis]